MKKKKLRIRGLHKRQTGAVLVYLAIAIVPFVAILGLVIDYGSAVVCRSRMQKAVDAGALAGAAYLPNTNAPDKAAEVAIVNYSKSDGYEVNINGDEITVTMKRSVPTSFMKIFGQNSLAVGVTATAIKPLSPSKIVGHMMPFCLINPNNNLDEDDDLVPSNWGKKYILFYGEDNLVVQDWANGNIGVGEQSPLIEEALAKNNSMGWRSALTLDLSALGIGGAEAMLYSYVNGYPGEIEIDDLVPTETGNTASVPMNGTKERLFGEEDYLFENFDPDYDYDIKRVIFVPIVTLLMDGSTTEPYTIDHYIAGTGHDWNKHYVRIDGFAPFYLLTDEEQGDVDGDGAAKDKGWITGYYIPGTRAPSGSSGGGADFGTKVIPKLVN